MQPNPNLHSNPIAFGEALREVQIVKVSLSELERKWRLREQDAYARGVADGERALSEQLVQQRADLRHLQNRLFVQFENAIPQVVRDCEQALIAIAWETARKVVNSVEITPSMVEAALEEALASLRQTGRVRVQLHAEDMALIEGVNSPVLLKELGGERIHFEVSSEVGRGGCLVYTDFGKVDARREVKLELLRQSMES
jgi:flagellar biosynthesis/type III secretory pathway protein FliH